MTVWPRRVVAVHAAVAGLFAVLATGFVVTSGAPAWAWSIGPLVALAYFGVTIRRYLRRRRLLAAPFPPPWRAVLDRKVSFYRELDPAGRRRFEDDVRIFVAEQTIYGAHGVTVDDETRVLIAASAAMLAHGLPEFEWPSVRDIVVYPGTFDEAYDVGRGTISGMVHAQGPVLFSMEDLRHGFRRPHDGHNVALHEFAHVMDMATGAADGLPLGLSWVATAPWVELMVDRLRRIRGHRYQHVLRDYAGSNEAEFFAVAVEVFFEQPGKLRGRDPELYAMLAEYFAQDPAASHADD